MGERLFLLGEKNGGWIYFYNMLFRIETWYFVSFLNRNRIDCWTSVMEHP